MWSIPFDALPHPLYRDHEWIASPDNYPVTQLVSEVANPTSILEIGTMVGYSLIALIAGSRPERLERIGSMDNESYLQGSQQLAWENVYAYLRHVGRPLPEFCFARRIEEVPTRHRWDLIHVDGDHSYDGCLRDLRWAESLSPRVILVDDVQHLPDVRQAVRRHFGRRYDWLEIDSYRGLGVVDLTDGSRIMEQIIRELPPYWTNCLHRAGSFT